MRNFSSIQSQAMLPRYTVRLAFVFTLLGLLASCANPITGTPNEIPSEAEAALLSANELELFSLDPSVPEAEGDGRFHGWQVLGNVTLTGKAKGRVLAALQQSIPKYDDGLRAGCFWPRHGIRVRAGDKHFDFVICFECTAAGVYANDEVIGSFQLSKGHREAQRVLDDELTQAGVKLPKPASK